MTHCPECRAPIVSLMMIDARNLPEYDCDSCAQAWPVVEPRPSESRRPVCA
jgi:hypothetical protein